MKETYENIVSAQIGPVTVGFILKGAAGLFILMICLTLILAAVPYIEQLHLGIGWGLSEALHKKDFDAARELILKNKGINKVNEYNQNPLLLALEAGQPELARLLIEAGADVNIKSKMYMTPLRAATQSGDLETVKLLLAKGASPDAPEDEFPPLFYAISKGYDDIARVLIEGGTDLSRAYIDRERRLTAGDLAVLAKKPILTEMIRQRGGRFTKE
jgi:ankyrin repeat protein